MRCTRVSSLLYFFSNNMTWLTIIHNICPINWLLILYTIYYYDFYYILFRFIYQYWIMLFLISWFGLGFFLIYLDISCIFKLFYFFYMFKYQCLCSHYSRAILSSWWCGMKNYFILLLHIFFLIVYILIIYI